MFFPERTFRRQEPDKETDGVSETMGKQTRRTKGRNGPGT